MGSECRMQMETSLRYLLRVATAELCHTRNEDKITYFATNPWDANNLTGKAKQHPPSLQRNPVAGDGKRPWIMSPTSPVELFLNILVKRFQEVFRRQYKVPKPLSVHAISAYLLIFIWTFCVLVAASLGCDITGKKKLIIFSSEFSTLPRADCTFFECQNFEFHWENKTTTTE